VDRQSMKLASDINATLKEYWERTREPGEPFCRRCGIPEYATADPSSLQLFEFAGQSFYLCYRCQEAVLSALWPDKLQAPPAGEQKEASS